MVIDTEIAENLICNENLYYQYEIKYKFNSFKGKLVKNLFYLKKQKKICIASMLSKLILRTNSSEK